MRGLTLAALVSVLLGCPVAVDADLPLPYRCDPASALGDEQCAGGWRCSADGLCRDPSVGAPVPCTTSADCAGGWHCGTAGVCYDRALAGAIPCRPELEATGSDCADGWRCPSGGICQQVGVFGAYPCQTTADCEAGGHCGLLGRCYLRETAGDIPCRQELDQDPDLRDCAPDWVCSGNGRCVDARSYELRPNGPLPTSTLRSAGAGAVTAVAAECFRNGQSCKATTALSVAREAAVELYRLPTTGEIPPPTALSLPAPVGVLATTTAADGGELAYSLLTVGDELLHVSWPAEGDGEPTMTVVSAPFLPERILAPNLAPWFIALRGPELFLVTHDGASLLGPVGLPEAQDGGALVYDELTLFGLASDAWMVALTAEGAYAARARSSGTFALADGGTQALPEWTPVRVPGTTHQACAGDDGGTGALTRIVPASGGSSGSGTFRQVRVAVVPAEGALSGRPAVYSASVRVDATPTSCASLATSVTTMTPACPEGAQLEGLHAITGAVLCAVPLPDGGVLLGEASSGAEPTLLPGELGGQRLTAVAEPVQGAWAYGGSGGQVIVRSPIAPTTRPLLLNRAPSHLSVQDGGTVVAHVGVGGASLGYALTPAGWRLANFEAAESCTSVRDAEAYRLRSQGLSVSLHGPSPTVILANSDGVRPNCAVDSSIFGQQVTLRDGGAGAIIAANDRLWANAPFPPDGGESWPVRVVPAAFARITSLAALRPTAETAGWASAYVLANEQVFSVRGDSINRWTSAELPSPSGEPFRVWADPELGRVTYRDGTTYSLPLLAPVSGPAPGASPRLSELRESCGAAYALDEGGELFRLEEDGEWSSLPLPAVASRWTKLHQVGDTLYGFTDQGDVFEVASAGCLRP